jgi:hypothetical protein
MPTDSIVVILLIVAGFLLFAGVLMWGDFQTRQSNK